MTPEGRKRLAGEIASSVGRALGQEYRVHDDGAWWLYTLGRAVRPLEGHEVAWHVARNHAPFVAGGVGKDDPRWWDEPATREAP